MLAAPATVYQGLGFAVHSGLGLRLYTRMRHFSIGLEVLALMRLPTTSIMVNGVEESELAFGLGILPTLRYTF